MNKPITDMVPYDQPEGRGCRPRITALESRFAELKAELVRADQEWFDHFGDRFVDPCSPRTNQLWGNIERVIREFREVKTELSQLDCSSIRLDNTVMHHPPVNHHSDEQRGPRHGRRDVVSGRGEGGYGRHGARPRSALDRGDD